MGDWGWSADNFQHAHAVMDQINEMKIKAEKDTIEDFDFFVTTGDNLYPIDAENPTKEEFDAMMYVFEKHHALKELPIYPVRGNHDCYFLD